ncbi:hypothetical protein AWB71_02877 [Caballeronia peredens]|nr:hypothetical protein AWB71_02877 [Caballeronia peredens]
MNKLPRPDNNDAAAFQNVASDARLASYPNLQPIVPAVLAGYAQYAASNGNVARIAGVPISGAEKALLLGHYNRPPRALAHIANLRKDGEHRVCPMCGSLHSGTLDHILPKETHAAFAVFSLNLVPACKCNTRRGTTTTGAGVDERILHPYFDECLSDRLLAARFDDLGRVPSISLQILLPPNHPEFSAVSFHVERIVGKTSVLEYLIERWTHLCQKPSRIVRALANEPQTAEALQEIVLSDLQLTDETHGGKNNWNSLFLAGLLDAHVLQWLTERFTTPGRVSGTPLV